MTLLFVSVPTPIGLFSIAAENDKIAYSFWDDAFPSEHQNVFDGKDVSVLKEAKKQVEAFFGGALKEFKLPLLIKKTPFIQQVLNNCIAVPYGETATYQDLAFHAPRAVGFAMRTNPFPLFIPCHRIVPKNGGLGGYMGKQGLDKKRFLLDFEEKNRAKAHSL